MLKKFIAFSLALGLFSSVSFAHHKHEDERQEVTVKTVKITDRVYMLQGRGGNVGVSVGEDGILIVDDDYAQVAPKIAEALKALGSDKPRFVFNTHWHGDHTQGNQFFGKDSIIIAHTNVRRRLAVESTIFGAKVQPYPKFALPLVTFDQSIRIHFNNDEIYARHYPNGHTDGDAVIFFTQDNVIHTGDDFVFGRFPFIDSENGGSLQGLVKNLGDIIASAQPDVKIIPGHGQLSTLEDLKTFHRTVIETVDIVRKGMMAGKTLEGLKKEGLPEKYKSWGTGFIKTDAWIEAIYKSLSTKSN